MKLLALTLLVSSCFIFEKSFSREQSEIGEKLANLARLEEEKKWKKALVLYRELEESFPFLMTRRFTCRKGVCEMLCEEFSTAEESFTAAIDGVKMEAVHEIEKSSIIGAMFNLAYVQARLGKINESKKSLIRANENFEKMGDLAKDSTWIAWRTRNDARVRAAISSTER